MLKELTPQQKLIAKACDDLKDLLLRKNHDYGDSFAEQYSKYGIMASLIRMDDKMARLNTLRQSTDAPAIAESLADTLLDLSGYALLSFVEEQKDVKDDV